LDVLFYLFFGQVFLNFKKLSFDSSMGKPKKVLFLCTGNSARSQMAEGLARDLSKGILEVSSAGLNPKGIHPMAIEVMDEMGINIRSQTSKKIELSFLLEMDVIITVCSNAESHCPATPPKIRKEHWPLEDPAQAKGSQQEIREAFRQARSDLHSLMVPFIQKMISNPGTIT
jgi:arsenate reductase